jgi:hypothetical protein
VLKGPLDETVDTHICSNRSVESHCMNATVMNWIPTEQRLCLPSVRTMVSAKMEHMSRTIGSGCDRQVVVAVVYTASVREPPPQH